MLFKAVTDEELGNYDPETINLYRRRDISERDVSILHSLKRQGRNYIPVVVNKENKII